MVSKAKADCTEDISPPNVVDFSVVLLVEIVGSVDFIVDVTCELVVE